MGDGLTQEQLESIQIDYGILYANYGEPTQERIGPTRGGGEFNVTANIREIDYDGRKGKTKGAQVIDELNAMLKFSLMNTALATLAKFMPQGTYDAENGKISAASLGVIPASKYLDNLTMFAKVVGGSYKMIVIYNAMNEANFVLPAAPKAEGVIPVEVHAHWDYADPSKLYDIEDIENISDDVTAPQVTTDPPDEATEVPIDGALTATFDEAVNENDIVDGNFLLIKASDGSVVAGSLTYSAANKRATFTPAEDLEASSTAYLWTIARVRDLAGNTMDPVVVNFTTESAA